LLLFFAPIQNQISIVKDNAGKTYLPQFGINTIGDMKPGQGYRVKASSNVILMYQANFKDPVEDQEKNKTISGTIHFVLDSNLNTGNNATLILPAAIADEIIHFGAEIGIFTPAGILCGAAAYQGENLAITVWGDDATTIGIIEGMQAGEAYNFKVWKAAEQVEYAYMATLMSNTSSYEPDAIEVITSMQFTSDIEELTISSIQALKIFPNPATEILNISINSETPGKAHLAVYSQSGTLVLKSREIDYHAGNTIYTMHIPARIPSGTYWLRFRFEKGTISRQVFIQK
jgi:hypothetical protein